MSAPLPSPAGPPPGHSSDGNPLAHSDPLAIDATVRRVLPARVTTGLVTIVLVTMVLLPVAQSVARIFGGDIPSATGYVQHLTLWVGFLGAVLATLSGDHLALSTANFVPAGRARSAAQTLTAAVSAAVTALLAVGAFTLVMTEKESGTQLSGGLPVWLSELVMPVAMVAIAARFLWHAPRHGLAEPSTAARWTHRAFVASLVGVVFALPLLGPAGAPGVLLPGLVCIGAAFMLGAPVFVAMAGLALLFFFIDGDPIAAVPTATFELVTNPTLPAVPLLTVAGYVLATGGASKRLVTAYRSLLGWMPGGMALMALSVCALFTTFTGGSGVTILAMGGILLPSLLEEKYPERFSLGLVTAAGSLGLLFPPSLPVLLYGVVAQQSSPEVDIKKLYLAGLVPGILVLAMVVPYAIWVGVKAGAPRHPFSPKEALRALWVAKWDLGLPVLVIALIATGITTVVESAAIAAFYSIVVEVVIFRTLHPLRDLPRALGSGATLVGAVLILLGAALAFTNMLVMRQIPDQLLEYVQQHLHSQAAFLLALNVILLVLGSVLEMYSAIVVLAPLVAPLGVHYGVDPVHLGVVFLANLELGFLLPPMGLNLMLSATRFRKPLGTLYQVSFPFLVLMTIGVLIVTYVPSLTTGVLALLGVK